ncbi:hypothetical protein C2845_PM16G22070 [Panicum miliaceum]|uniref:Uncharacterized protein n=1 Tax=Panicum miliaceum TaxID=4540 RepID=A0A3L6PX03_PANMI|nr:hypothetical protein C2845_PM16G22070 [Panicum miliaceum]
MAHIYGSQKEAAVYGDHATSERHASPHGTGHVRRSGNDVSERVLAHTIEASTGQCVPRSRVATGEGRNPPSQQVAALRHPANISWLANRGTRSSIHSGRVCDHLLAAGAGCHQPGGRCACSGVIGGGSICLPAGDRGREGPPAEWSSCGRSAPGCPLARHLRGLLRRARLARRVAARRLRAWRGLGPAPPPPWEQRGCPGGNGTDDHARLAPAHRLLLKPGRRHHASPQ